MWLQLQKRMFFLLLCYTLASVDQVVLLLLLGRKLKANSDVAVEQKVHSEFIVVLRPSGQFELFV